jgi:glycosyltransferase involved in cell wall biosynthesis
MNLNISGPVNSFGYGRTVYNLLKALDKLGNNITFISIGQPQPETNEEISLLQKLINNQDNFDIQAPSILIYHQFALLQHCISKNKYIAMPIFEGEGFTPREKVNLSVQDRLFVCSHWAKSMIEQFLPGIPTYVVPLGVDTSIFYNKNKYGLIPYEENKPYTFINTGKMELRKSINILYKIFNLAFEPTDNVSLIMSVDNPFYTPEEFNKWVNIYKSSKLGDKITFINKCPTQSHLSGIFRQCDCCVAISKSEGFDLPLLECLATGLPAIVTNVSAHQEYCNNENAFLISETEKELAEDGKWFHSEKYWMKFTPDAIDQCVEYMRKCYKERITTNPAGVETAKKFSWTRSAQAFIEGLK